MLMEWCNEHLYTDLKDFTINILLYHVYLPVQLSLFESIFILMHFKITCGNQYIGR